MIKTIFLTTILGLSVARPGGLAGHGVLLGGSAYGAHGLGALVPSSGVSTSSRADVFGPSIAYLAGAPFPGAVLSPHGVNAGITHASIATPIIGTVATGYGGHGYGSLGGLGGHVLGGHY